MLQECFIIFIWYIQVYFIQDILVNVCFYVKSSCIYIICCLYFKEFLMIHIHKWKIHLVKFVHLELYFILLILTTNELRHRTQNVTPVKGEVSDKFSTYPVYLSLPHLLGHPGWQFSASFPKRLCGTQVQRLPHISILQFNFPKSFLCRVYRNTSTSEVKKKRQICTVTCELQ